MILKGKAKDENADKNDSNDQIVEPVDDDTNEGDENANEKDDSVDSDGTLKKIKKYYSG